MTANINQKVVPRTLKGFRDFLPDEVRKRQYAIDIIRRIFELYGFEPLETPALEYLDIFKGSIGEGEQMFYKFTDAGGRQVALRYDQTVPASRVVAQYPDKIKLPFKRYQIQTVWRAEKPQKGRYREFLQCDADIFGGTDRTADAETIALTIDIYKNLGFKKPIAIINDRDLYRDIAYEAIIAIDKLEKIGQDKVITELKKRGYQNNRAMELLNKIKNNKPNDNLNYIFKFLDNYGMKENYRFSPTLARSFSYSNGTIWEIIAEGFSGGSLAGCERFDNVVSRFSENQVPGVGFAVGFDRTILAMEEMGLFPDMPTNTMIMVTAFNKVLVPYSQKITLLLRENQINTDLYPDPNDKLEKQLKYADDKKIPFVAILGPDEEKSNKVTVKNLKTKTQETIPTVHLLDYFKK